ncbi:DUF3089 domain-containing protein [Sphingomonas sp. ID0503]|uniref:DUF3089 domain-containing protein n=1 Tax=Sphingomonas sp. ID0503 TaxID=3399691 RepID=UPI003AFAA0E8
MLARRFLYIIAGLVFLVLVSAIVWSMFQDRIIRYAMIPSVPFEASAAGPAPDYTQDAAWLARPGLRDNPALVTPASFTANPNATAAVFYVTPTTYLRGDRWNAPLDDGEARKYLTLFARGQASAFNSVGQIWAPRYRQASFGVFLTDEANARRALDFAYADILRAWETFLAAQPADRPIILAGHSQGTVHLLRLMKERVAGQAIARRIAAAYLVGWPISLTADIPALGLPACARADQANCILSWQSFAEPADAHQIVQIYESHKGATGKPLKGTAMLCVNPLTGVPGTSAPASANLGAIVPERDLSGSRLVPGKVGARCDASGFLLIGEPPEGYDGYVMPGNNYHVYDYSLFWANIRRDAERRLAAFVR